MSKHVREKEHGLNLPFMQNIGMRLCDAADDELPKAVIDVTEQNCQPWGFLCGGATIAAAETLAGVASCRRCPENVVVGMSVTANHIHSARLGEKVMLTATPIHIGQTTHVWRIDARNERDHLISTVTVTNYIVTPQNQ